MVDMSWTILKLPYWLIHSVYHAVIPYRIRIVLWAYRRQVRRSIKEFIQAKDRKLIEACRIELKEIIRAYPDAKGIILFPPSVEWDTTLFQRPHQMAMAFASLGYLVLYWVRIDSVDNVKRFRKVAERLYLCNVPPRAFSMIERPITITYTYNYNWASQLNAPIIVYEMIDHLEIFSNFPLPLLQHYHKILLRRAKVVIGTASPLVTELARYRPDAILCLNGVDVDHFVRAGESSSATPDDMRQIVAEGKPVVGYYGALAEWFDYHLLKHVATELPEYNFVLIGPDYDLSMERSGIQLCSNIYWLGPKDYRQLPGYLRLFDVATIPFRATEAIQAVSPIKLFEYMAGERPIVTSDLIECRRYSAVLIAKTPDEWVERLQQALQLRQDAEYLEKLRATARENTWSARARTIIAALEATLPGRPSPAVSLSTAGKDAH